MSSRHFMDETDTRLCRVRLVETSHLYTLYYKIVLAIKRIYKFAF